MQEICAIIILILTKLERKKGRKGENSDARLGIRSLSYSVESVNDAAFPIGEPCKLIISIVTGKLITRDSSLSIPRTSNMLLKQ